MAGKEMKEVEVYSVAGLRLHNTSAYRCRKLRKRGTYRIVSVFPTVLRGINGVAVAVAATVAAAGVVRKAWEQVTGISVFFHSQRDEADKADNRT
jgi:hypothetical protein